MVCLRVPTVVLQCFHLLPCWQAEKSKKPIRYCYCGRCERSQACHSGLMVVSGVCSPEMSRESVVMASDGYHIVSRAICRTTH